MQKPFLSQGPYKTRLHAGFDPWDTVYYPLFYTHGM